MWSSCVCDVCRVCNCKVWKVSVNACRWVVITLCIMARMWYMRCSKSGKCESYRFFALSFIYRQVILNFVTCTHFMKMERDPCLTHNDSFIEENACIHTHGTVRSLFLERNDRKGILFQKLLTKRTRFFAYFKNLIFNP
jgi:hypothetical protein